MPHIQPVILAAGVMENCGGAQHSLSIMRQRHFIRNQQGKQQYSGTVILSMFLAVCQRKMHFSLQKIVPVMVVLLNRFWNRHIPHAFLSAGSSSPK